MSGTVAIHSIPFQGKKPVLSMQQLSAVSVAPVIYHQSASDPILAFASPEHKNITHALAICPVCLHEALKPYTYSF